MNRINEEVEKFISKNEDKMISKETNYSYKVTSIKSLYELAISVKEENNLPTTDNED